MLADLFLPRAILLTVLVPDRVTCPPPVSPAPAAVPGVTAWLATGSAMRAAWAPVASRCRLIAMFMSRS